MPRQDKDAFLLTEENSEAWQTKSGQTNQEANVFLNDWPAIRAGQLRLTLGRDRQATASLEYDSNRQSGYLVSVLTGASSSASSGGDSFAGDSSISSSSDESLPVSSEGSTLGSSSPGVGA